MRPLFDPFAASSSPYPANTAIQEADTAKQRQNRSTAHLRPAPAISGPSAAVLTRPGPGTEVELGPVGQALVANHTAGEAGQDWSQGRPPWPVRHVPTGRGGGAEGAVPKNPPSHRWAAAGPFAAMTAVQPVASRSPDRTDVCCAGRSAPSQCGVVTGPSFSSPNQPDQVRTTAYHDSSGPESRSDGHGANIVGNWKEPSGESRIN